MPNPTPDLEQEPKTLGAAKARLRELQQEILNSRTGRARLAADEQPPAPARVIVLNSRPAPEADPNAPLDPDMAPAKLRSMLGGLPTSRLRSMLGIETSRPRKEKRGTLISMIYDELKSRGASTTK
jgi:hypothetical protein